MEKRQAVCKGLQLKLKLKKLKTGLHRESLVTQNGKVADIVWAKLLHSKQWWPALIISGSDCGKPAARSGHVWVFWFGDHRISEVPCSNLLDFVSQFDKHFSLCDKRKSFINGVEEAAGELSLRAGYNSNSNLTNSRSCDSVAQDSGHCVSKEICQYLDKLKTQNRRLNKCNLKNKSKDDCVLREARNASSETEDSVLNKVKNDSLKIEDICIACRSPNVAIVAQHPLFQGGLCKKCQDEIISTMFAYGKDGISEYCIICGQRGELAICDNNECNRCYCAQCIDHFVKCGEHKQILEMTPWLCFLCSNYEPVRNGLLHPKKDWKQNVMQMFQPERNVPLTPSHEDYKEKRPIRVLSLFDGIGTGKYVLDSLGIAVDVYYASEIDDNAMIISVVQHQGTVKQLGEIGRITDAQIATLCPVDLVIGGSPCNDLSLVNPARKGLYDASGTGKLFFDFFRVLKAVQLSNRGKHVFWLYENVAAMPLEYKSIISKFLQCEPAKLDSKYFSAQKRARYFWGNIPGMYSRLQSHDLEKCVTLDSVLTPHLNRKASVEQIRTVTTRSNSLKQGKDNLLPVIMNGEEDALWITELEKIFGFPLHWTDVGNISVGRRQQLLGKAWSVPVIKHLFAPLKNFFASITSVASH